ncbi:MAG: VWA domain-containing protein [Thermoplasmata archaeon]|nr:VWA domain-containing protein [Thermoplasmata archaeon]
MSTDTESLTSAPVPGQRERHILVLDLSKSMLAPLPDPTNPGQDQQKIEVARTAVYRILENAASSGAAFGLVTFTETPRVAVPLTEMRRDILPSVEGLISMLQPSGRSAIWDALALAADLLRSMNGGVRGTIVLVTDGWDNASTRFTVYHPEIPVPTPGPKLNLTEYLLPHNSELTLRVIGIGSGSERDKGVDSGRMGTFLAELERRSRDLALASSFSFQEVVTGSQLFSQMVHAFLDVGFEESRPFHELHPEELARHAASAARALKDPEQHATVGRLSGPRAQDLVISGAPVRPAASDAAPLEVDIVDTPGGTAPAYLRDRYGPLGVVIESFLAGEYDRAFDRLERARSILPPVTLLYWEARIQFAKGQIVEAARSLLRAWSAAEQLPSSDRPRIIRRLALLQARMQSDRETETLVRFMDETESRLGQGDPKVKERVLGLFERLMDLRSTYQLTRIEGTTSSPDGAVRHEEAVEQAFGALQDARLENTSGDPGVEGALDFIEICLAEMR